MKAKYELAIIAKNSKEEEITACSSEIESINAVKIKTDKICEKTRIEITKIDQKLINLEKNGKDAKKELDTLIKANNWIVKEKSFFGKKDSDFDFEAKSVPESKKRLQELAVMQVRSCHSYLHFMYMYN